MPENLGLLSFRTLGQNGVLNSTRNSLEDTTDYKNPQFLFPIVRDVLSTLTDVNMSKLNVLSLRAVGLSTIPDYRNEFRGCCSI